SGLPVDHRADVFAVGIILWELFTGKRLFYGDTDYQTVELVRQARVPSLIQHNSEIEPELDQVVRKALAQDPDERYQNAADLGDALAQFLFSRRMKVTARDIAALVKDTQVEMMRKRSAEPKESLINGLIMDEMQKMTSLVEGEEPTANSTGEGSMSLDPSTFVDTSNWAGDLANSQQGNGRTPSAKKQTRPPPNKSKPPATTGGGEVESLEHILEPDRTGMHKKGESKPPWAIIIVVMVLLAAGAAVAVVFAMG
ncbi:MAG: protein kinase, partial [Polyangiales bacterium]